MDTSLFFVQKLHLQNEVKVVGGVCLFVKVVGGVCLFVKVVVICGKYLRILNRFDCKKKKDYFMTRRGLFV